MASADGAGGRAPEVAPTLRRMAFNFPEGLSPDVYPLAWLVGSWRGFGMLGYPNVPETPILQEVTVDHDGGPYLRLTSTIWIAKTRSGMEIHQELTGAQGAERLEKQQIWSTQTEYWRPLGEVAGGTAGDGGAVGAGAASRTPTNSLEVFSTDPAGFSMLFVGEVTGPRINLATDAVMRSATGAAVAGAKRMYGLVQGDLLWAEDLAAFGQELQSYASARLTRVDDGADGTAADGTGGADEQGAS